ncbi:PilW family protein [Comamonas composti]|uniref:PilW family protein n=1 Tax=Comamonas composti TaxID=408558 RepID=UPI0003F8290B|nr:PilW family protein [Comamonas composti]
MHFQARRQTGVTLLELMVGIAIGLLIVAVAMGALIGSRSVSGTVSDVSGIQQQAAYAMRVIGQQLRQTGSLRLNLNPSGAPADSSSLIPVGFEALIPLDGASKATVIPLVHTTNGFTTNYSRYKESAFSNTSGTSFARNCLGGPKDSESDTLLESIFQFSNGQLKCGGNGESPQPMVSNVADFQVSYLQQDNTTRGETRIKYIRTAAEKSALQSTTDGMLKVQAVEVCLLLYGDELMDLPADGTYTDCSGASQKYASLTGTRARRMHLAFRSVFQLRSQGLITSST